MYSLREPLEENFDCWRKRKLSESLVVAVRRFGGKFINYGAILVAPGCFRQATLTGMRRHALTFALRKLYHILLRFFDKESGLMETRRWECCLMLRPRRFSHDSLV
jgi:hypothetical protein